MKSETCTVVTCGRAHRSRGLCRLHLYEKFPELAPAACSEAGCANRVQSRGLCATHYSRVLRAEKGIADPGQNYAGVDPIAKITSRCDIGLCWEWQRGTSTEGYGVVAHQGRGHYVHRLLWTLLVGPIAPGLEIDHLCKNTRCCNPDHLEPVTPRVNKLRGASPAAQYARRTTCAAGHAFTDTNTRITREGARHCMTCDERRRHEQGRTRKTTKQETNRWTR